jgi:hypothetical protein
MRLFLLFFALFCLKSAQIFAQTEKPIEVETIVHLKNGVVIRGQMIEWKQGDHLVIKTRDSLELQFSESQIDRIKQKRYGGPEAVVNHSYQFRETGWYNATNFGFILNNKNDDGQQLPSFMLSNATGWQVNRLLGIGAGIAVDHYGQEQLLYFVPIFIDLRTYLSTQKRSPYFNLMIGKGIPVENKMDELQSNSTIIEKKGGTFFSPNLGFRLGANPTSNWTLDFGMRLQKVSYSEGSFGFRLNRDLLFRRYTIRAGLIF